MKGNHFELEDALRNIVGIWHDPLTKDAYRFTAEEDGGRAEVFILQQALGTPLSFKYQITKDEAGVWLSIDGNKMKILQLTSYPQPVLSFQSANNTISLFKNDSSAIEDLNFTKG